MPHKSYTALRGHGLTDLMKPICADGLLTLLTFMNGVGFTPTSTSRSNCLPNSSNSRLIHGRDTSGGRASLDTSAHFIITCISSSCAQHTMETYYYGRPSVLIQPPHATTNATTGLLQPLQCCGGSQTPPPAPLARKTRLVSACVRRRLTRWLHFTAGCTALTSCRRRRGSCAPYQTTVAFCRTLVVAHCGPTPMTCGSCSCREHITNSVIGVSRPPVLDCGTTFHSDYGGQDLPSTPSDNLW